MLRLSIITIAALAGLAGRSLGADESSAVYAALQSRLEGSAIAADGLQAELDTLNARAFARQSAMGTAELRSADWFNVGGSITYRAQASDRDRGLGQSLLLDLNIYTQISPGVSMSLQLGNRVSPVDMIRRRGDDLNLKRAYLHITD